MEIEQSVRAVIWAAVSSKPQLKGRDPEEEGVEDAGDSLAVQIKDGRVLCEQRGWVVVEELEVPGHSRSDYWLYSEAAADMEAYARLQELAQARAMDVVVCRSLDRLGRGDSLLGNVQHLLRRSAVQVFELDNPTIIEFGQKDVTTDRLFTDAFKRVQAESEILKLRQKHRGGMLTRVEYKGLPPGQLPYGYRSVGKDDVPVMVPREVAVVRKIGELFLLGWGHRRIAGALNRNPDMGQPARGNLWSRATIQRMLNNEFYAGIIHYGRVRAPGRHEAVFSGEEWAAIQEERRRRRYARGKRPRYPYRGLVRCKTCGRSMSATSITNRAGKVYCYYRCGKGYSEKVEGRGGGHTTYVRVETIEAAVLGLAERLQDPRELEAACRDTAVEEREALRRERESAEVELEALKERMGRLVEAYTRWGRMAPEMFDEKMADAAAKQEELGIALAEAVALERRMPDPETRARRLMEYARDLKKVLDDSDVDEVNAWLSKRIRAIWCRGKEVIEVEVC
jgi:DNA invertase Pin-like site-specific DNA recombinase